MKNQYKKILSLFLVFAFLQMFITPAFAITENLKDKERSAFQTINIDKWRQKQDPYLEDCILRAVANNFDIKTATLKIKEAELNVKMQKANLMPTAAIGASPAILKMSGSEKTSGNFSLPIYASWEIDLFGKNQDKTKSAKKALEATKLDVESYNIAVVSGVIATYYNIVNLDKMIEIQADILKDRREIYRIMKISNQEGIVSTSDLIQAEKAFILAENELLSYKKAREGAINSLCVLIGENPNEAEIKRISLDKISTSFTIPNEINSEIITNRPDYKAVEKKIEAAGLNVRAAKKEFLPTIDILGLVSFIATSTASKMNWQNALAGAGANATFPLFTGFKRINDVKLNKTKYEELLQNYEKTNLTAIQEINDSLYNFKSDNEKLLNNLKAYEIQKKDYSLSKGKYDAGIISKLDLLQQKESLLYIQKLAAQAKTDCIIDEISLYKTTGAKL